MDVPRGYLLLVGIQLRCLTAHDSVGKATLYAGLAQGLSAEGSLPLAGDDEAANGYSAL